MKIRSFIFYTILTLLLLIKIVSVRHKAIQEYTVVTDASTTYKTVVRSTNIKFSINPSSNNIKNSSKF